MGIGSIIGGGLSIGSSIFGGISQARQAKKVEQNLKTQLTENQDWYDRKYNEDATQRGDAQRLIQMTEDSIRNRNRQAAGALAVAGASEESVASAKAQNNQALADTMSQINAQAEARKDAIEQQYLQTKQATNQQLNDLAMKKAANTAAAVKGVADAGASIANAF